jgi:hypothetical protein
LTASSIGRPFDRPGSVVNNTPLLLIFSVLPDPICSVPFRPTWILYRTGCVIGKRLRRAVRLGAAGETSKSSRGQLYARRNRESLAIVIWVQHCIQRQFSRIQ